MNLSRSISSSNSARRFPTSCRRKAISVSSALSTERRIDSTALGSTRYVEQMVFGWNILDRAPELVWQPCSFGFQVVLMPIRGPLVSIYMRHAGVLPRDDRGRKTVISS
jgi:hypothetical protein